MDGPEHQLALPLDEEEPEVPLPRRVQGGEARPAQGQAGAAGWSLAQPVVAVSQDPWAEVTDLEGLARIAAGCRRCGLRDGCRQVVFGEGNPRARVMLVGEGPGEQEDLLGRPFVGKAGQLLDRMLAAVGMRREEVYIANVVKCRPPHNRVPTPAEADACWPYLKRQLELVRPVVVVCLGATAARRLVDAKSGVTRLRGQWIHKDGRRYLVTFHPAALLRDPSKKREAWEDFKRVKAACQELAGRGWGTRAGRAREPLNVLLDGNGRGRAGGIRQTGGMGH